MTPPKNTRFRVVLAICIALFSAVLFLLSPIFSISEVVVLGNHRVSQDDIVSNLGANGNIFLLNTRRSRQEIMGNFHIGDVAITRNLPNQVVVTVYERRLSAYIEHPPGNFLFLDEHGRVLEVRSYTTEPLPLLQGLHISRFQLGELLDVPDELSFAHIMQYTQLLVAHGIIDRITHINISDPSNIRILINYLEFQVGGVQDADAKVRTIIEILAQLPNAHMLRGFVEMQEIGSSYRLRLLE